MPTIQELRARKGLTQRGLADCVGVHANTVARWERGEVSPDSRSRRLLAFVFGVGADDIEYGKPDSSPAEPREEDR